MDVFMPALIFSVMIQEDFYPTQYLMLIVGGALIMFGSGVLAFILARVAGWTPRSIIPTAMFSNWANLGIPLYVSALGNQALDGGVMLVVAGNILCFTIGTYIYSGKLSGLEVLKTPIIIAVILGLSINAISLPVPSFVDTPISMLGQVAIPLMLFSLGVRLTKVSLNDNVVGTAVAVFCPVVGVGLALLITRLLPLSEILCWLNSIIVTLKRLLLSLLLATYYP